MFEATAKPPACSPPSEATAKCLGCSEFRRKNGSGSASLYTNAEVVLLDRRTGGEIWFVKVHGTDRLTPRVYGAGGVGGSIIAAGTLHTMTVADFEQALDQLMTLSANVVADELRSALRDARR